MSTYYVSKSGSNGNNGLTEATAKLTITAMAAAIGAAGSSAGAGHTIEVGDGVYDESLVDVLPSGASSVPFTLRAKNQLGATIRRLSGLGACIGFNTPSDWIVIDGLKLVGVEAGASTSGGLYFSGAAHNTHHHVTIRNCQIGPSGMGIQASGARAVTVQNCLIHDAGSPTFEVGFLHCIYVSTYCDDWIIEDNETIRSFGYGIHVFSDHANPANRPQNFIIRRNTSRNNGLGGLNGAGIIVYGNGHQVYLNITADNFLYGIMVRSTGTTVDMNTIYGNGSGGLYNEAADLIARDNIIYGNSGPDISGPVSPAVNTANFTGNPLVVNAGTGNFRLTEASPARSSGVTIPGITHDFDGRALTDPPDPGAFQYGIGAVSGPAEEEVGGIVVPIDEGIFPELANRIESFDNVRFDNKIHAVTQEYLTGRVAYHVHDMATKRWATVNMEILASNSDGDTGCTICILESGEPCVVFMGDRVAKGPGHLFFGGMKIASAGDYRRAYMSRLVGGSWTAPEMVASPDDLVGTFYPKGFNFQGYVHVRVGRAIAEASDWGRFVFTVEVPGDVANTPELYTQRLRPDKALTTTDKVKFAASTWYTSTHVVGQPCVFEHEGTQYTAVPAGFTHHPMLFIWEGTGTAGPATIEIELVDFVTTVQVQPDTFGTLNPPISVHYFKGKLHVMMGTRQGSTSEWAAYKTISPPFVTLDPNPLTSPRDRQAGVTWPNNSYARQGVEFATVGLRDYIFKVATGNTSLVPGSTKKSILEKIDIETDIPGDNGYTVANFLADNP